MRRSGLSTSTSAVTWRSPAVASPGPRLSRRSVTGSSEYDPQDDVLQVQDDVGHIVLDAGERRELVQGVVEADLGHRGAGNGRKKRAPERVAERVAEAGLERAHRETLTALGLLA